MTPADHDFKVQLLWTALLVLFALSAAGLAGAVDRQHGSHRPELFWAAESRYGSWIDSAWTQLRAAGETLTNVSAAGREALGTLQSLNLDATEEHISAGDRALEALGDLENSMGTIAGATFAQIERWRLSPERQAQLSAIDSAASAARTVSGEWPLLAGTGRTMSRALAALMRHDELVARATAAAQQSRWPAALELLERAATELGAVSAARDSLAAQGSDVRTLADLLARYSAHDSALGNLYEHVRDTGRQEGDEFERLREAVDRAQAALPGNEDVLALIVGESAAPALTAALVRIEQARGEVLEALTLAPSPAP